MCAPWDRDREMEIYSGKDLNHVTREGEGQECREQNRQGREKVKIVFVVAANRADRSERQEANGKEQYRRAFPNRLNDKMTSTCRGQIYETRTSIWDNTRLSCLPSSSPLSCFLVSLCCTPSGKETGEARKTDIQVSREETETNQWIKYDKERTKSG